ncbi:hypothetical protein [Candidatus Synchoanobacter obligatus]|uniref:Uncharacterized protein n=1 Tax=Candidatus Synchoanobacter obligatus TaxID=2919597 RepID=A0ABT1L5F4_9GAMM|nr:hypothetical protein [Candidatus Synchoanobacter obligatus]MCP8352405.1 hypothetical protein [Candidatus Synchoanobacter obligatus]
MHNEKIKFVGSPFSSGESGSEFEGTRSLDIEDCHAPKKLTGLSRGWLNWVVAHVKRVEATGDLKAAYQKP